MYIPVTPSERVTLAPLFRTPGTPWENQSEEERNERARRYHQRASRVKRSLFQQEDEEGERKRRRTTGDGEEEEEEAFDGGVTVTTIEIDDSEDGQGVEDEESDQDGVVGCSACGENVCYRCYHHYYQAGDQHCSTSTSDAQDSAAAYGGVSSGGGRGWPGHDPAILIIQDHPGHCCGVSDQDQNSCYSNQQSEGQQDTCQNPTYIIYSYDGISAGASARSCDSQSLYYSQVS